jgi:hypothetical protein
VTGKATVTGCQKLTESAWKSMYPRHRESWVGGRASPVLAPRGNKGVYSCTPIPVASRKSRPAMASPDAGIPWHHTEGAAAESRHASTLLLNALRSWDSDDRRLDTLGDASFGSGSSAGENGGEDAANRSSSLVDEWCIHAEAAINLVTYFATNSTSELQQQVGGEGVLLPLVLMVVSLVLAVRGGKLLKPSCMVAAAAVGWWLVWDLAHSLVGLARTSESDPTGGLSCEARLIGATVLALVAAMSSFCIIKIGLFLLGALAAGGMVYLSFEAFPQLDDGPSFVANRSIMAWSITLLAGVLGGMLVRCNSMKVLELATSVAGGVGCAHSVHGLVAHAGDELPGAGYVAIAAVVAGPGWWLQRRARLKQDERGPRRQSSKQSSTRRTRRRKGLPDELSMETVSIVMPPPAAAPGGRGNPWG